MYFLSVVEKLWPPEAYQFQRLYHAKHSSTPEEEKYEAVSSRFRLATPEMKSEFKDVWRGRTLRPVDRVPLGVFDVLLGKDETVSTRKLASAPAFSIIEDDQVNVFSALNWRARLSSLEDRSKLLQGILDWALDGDLRPKIMLISGPGGSGKSRLGHEALRILESEHRWACGDLPAQLRQGDIIEADGEGVLVIADYPEENQNVIECLLKSCEANQTYFCPVRVLLVSREGKDVWRKRLNRPILHNLSEITLETDPFLSPDASYKIAEEVSQNLAKLIKVRVPTLKRQSFLEWCKADIRHNLPIFVVAAAIHAVLNPKNAYVLAGRDLLLALAEVELLRIRSYSRRDLGNDFDLERLLALAILTPNGLHKDSILSLSQNQVCAQHSASNLFEAVQKTPFWVRRTEENGEHSPGHILRFQPDRPAAALFYLALSFDDEASPRLPKWFSIVASQAGMSFGSILSRVSFDLSEIDEHASKAVEDNARLMVRDTPSLMNMLSDLAYQGSSAFSAGFSIEITHHALARPRMPHDRGVLLENLTFLMMGQERHQEAIDLADEALQIRRLLARNENEAVLADLASGLATYSSCLSKLQNKSEALPPAAEAVDILRRLSKVNPQAHFVQLVLAIERKASALRDLGRLEEARSLTQEAAEICDREIISASPEYLPLFAALLNNLATDLKTEKHTDAALDAALRAVKAYRTLCGRRPDLYSDYLAGALHTISTVYLQKGDFKSSLRDSQESVNIRRRLTEGRMSVFVVGLTTSISGMAKALGESGDFLRATIYQEEVIELLESIRLSNPSKFKEKSAAALNNLAAYQLQIDRLAEAKDNGRLSVEIYRDLSKDYPDTFCSYLAQSLTTLARTTSRLGEQQSAMSYSFEALQIWRQLAAARPDVCDTELAASLIDYADRLTAENDFAAALPLAREAIHIYSSPKYRDRSLHNFDITRARTNFAKILSRSGQDLEAMAQINQAISLLDHMHQANRNSFNALVLPVCLNYIQICRAHGCEIDKDKFPEILDKLFVAQDMSWKRYLTIFVRGVVPLKRFGLRGKKGLDFLYEVVRAK